MTNFPPYIDVGRYQGPFHVSFRHAICYSLQYLYVNEWQVAGVRKAMVSLDRGESVPHEQVKAWVKSWGGKRRQPAPKRSAK